MTNQELQKQVEDLQARLSLLEAFVINKKEQQISLPIDLASKQLLFDVAQIKAIGTGTATTQSIFLTGNPQTITPPAQPTGTVKVLIEGVLYELLYK